MGGGRISRIDRFISWIRTWIEVPSLYFTILLRRLPTFLRKWGTLIALVALIAQFYYGKTQIEIVREEFKMSWRPIVDIGIDPVHSTLDFAYGIRGKQLAFIPGIVKITDPLIGLVDSLVMKAAITVVFRNRGRLPGWILQRRMAVFTEREWLTRYSKSIDSLVKSAPPPPKGEFTDVVIYEDSVIRDDSIRLSAAIMSLEDFDNLRKNGQMNLYCLVWVKYSDFFGHSYNTLHLEGIPIRMETDSGLVKFTNEPTWIEKHRWDLDLRTRWQKFFDKVRFW